MQNFRILWEFENFPNWLCASKRLKVNLTRHGLTCYVCFYRRIHRKSRSSTVRRMGAWVDDRFAEEEAVPINQGPRRRKALRILGHVCDGGGPDATHQRTTTNYRNSCGSSSSASSLLPLRRQFTRQLYEWPGLPLFKSRTKLDLFWIRSHLLRTNRRDQLSHYRRAIWLFFS